MIEIKMETTEILEVEKIEININNQLDVIELEFEKQISLWLS